MSDFNLDTEFKASVTLHQAGRPEQASQGYRRVLAAVPHQPVVMGYLGMAMAQAERQGIAVAYLRRSLALSGEDPAVCSNLGNALAALTRRREAMVAYRRSIALAPAFCAPICSAAVLEPRPELRAIGLLRAIGCEPTHVPALVALAAVNDVLGRADAARRWAHRAVACGPGTSAAHLVLADHLLSTGQAPIALGQATRALVLGGDTASALFRLAATSERLDALDEAERHYRRTLTVAPGFAAAHASLGSLALGLGFPGEAVAAYRRASAIEGLDGVAEGNRLFALTFLEPAHPQALVIENRRWAARAFPAKDEPTRSLRPRRPADRLRVGYVSHEFVKHASLLHLLPMLDHHDRSRFEIRGYAQMAHSDRSTDDVRRRFEGWRHIAHLSLDEQAATIRGDDVDVLVNLTGYIATQRALFAHRISPAQIAYMNHVSTTGLATIDGRVTDAWLEPEGAVFLDRDEPLYRMKTGYLCYAPPDAPPLDELPALRRSFVTFGVFNNLAKASDDALATWARILERVPRSRILIKGYGLSAPRAQSRILAAFARRGVDAGRVELVGRVDGDLANLATIARADIALDPFPFNGGMSTVETLWMGVPVVSLVGPSLVHRIGLTYLTRAGFPEWAVSSVDAYVDLAVALAADVGRLAALRRDMRGKLQRSVLFDAASHTRELEGVYLDLWRKRTGERR